MYIFYILNLLACLMKNPSPTYRLYLHQVSILDIISYLREFSHKFKGILSSTCIPVIYYFVKEIVIFT